MAEFTAKHRENAIATIEMFYPADSIYPESRAIGAALLEEARRSAWRDEPTSVLIKYAQLCIEEDRKG